MGRRVDYVRQKFGPMLDKSLKNAVAHAIGRDFPRIGGPRIRQLCAEMILEVVKDHWRPREHIGHGQVLWLAVDVDDPPAYGKHIADTRLIPVVLELSTGEDVQARLDRKPPRHRLMTKMVRLCKQAHQQGALLSNCDLAEVLNKDVHDIGQFLASYERDTGKIVPRRATLHDMGSGLTHKSIICRKRYAEGKSSDQIARETYHSVEAVDRYLGQFDRVRHCRMQEMSVQETAFTLDCSVSLVREYLKIDRELRAKSAKEKTSSK